MAPLCKPEQKEVFLASLQASLGRLGFDIVHPFAAQSYNETEVGKTNPLPEFSQRSTLSIYIANTKTFWEVFLRQYDSTKLTAVEAKDPIDHYCEHHIPKVTVQALQDAGLLVIDQNMTKTSTPFTVAFSHYKPSVPAPGSCPEGSPDTGFVPPPEKVLRFQQVAHFSGLAFFNPVSYLSMHPTYGPWTGLRALIVVDLEYDPSQDNAQLFASEASRCGTTTLDSTALPSNPAFALLRQQPDGEALVKDRERIIQEKWDALLARGYENRDWREWIDFRKTTAIDRPDWQAWQYSEQQILYHYTKCADRLQGWADELRERERT
ncbi:hypothetical protein DFQ27_000687 [Actinomortierella ambigua]|uniref:Cyanocobalamin reductase (cyanide-eliminating) n=1 Tax=Actinomortierella ambigua TaxID=1343610 RepID=A0A9P6QGB1_9FUNG|nr:hypothetical protein DFQ27_000687 [Actinomortierella ambigua]